MQASISGIPVWRQMEWVAKPGIEVQHLETLIVGAGPVGLALALDLGRRGHKVVLLNRLDFVPAGSKAICFSKRSLDIFDRLGVGDAMVAMGVTWNVGKVFHGRRSEPIYEFDLLPVKDQRRPAFINIQQYHVEDLLIAALAALPNIEIRWGHELLSVTQDELGAHVDVSTVDGDYQIDADWLIACDGSRSPVRTSLDLDFEGRVFEDNFLIADIKMEDDRPSERWFWFDPPFNPGQSALLHKQPDNVWRLDFQLGPGIDRAECVKPENVERLVRAMLGDNIAFEPVWYSVYTFQCRRMARFVHDRIIFAGDSAHLVSPFGARGCNGGLADIDNLGWKLDLILHGAASPSLLESYNDEAIITADENILNSTRSTDFLTPKSTTSRAFRDAVLELALDHPFARPFVNSGRLSTAISYSASTLTTLDMDNWTCGIAPGEPALDAPMGDGWLLALLSDEFTLLANGWIEPEPQGVRLIDIAPVAGRLGDLLNRYALTPGAAYLIRPDQYVAARWVRPTAALIRDALDRAKGGRL